MTVALGEFLGNRPAFGTVFLKIRLIHVEFLGLLNF
jgi:hypothetical protein